MMRPFLFALITLLASTSAHAQGQLYRVETFDAYAPGGTGFKLIKEMGTRQAQALITAGCAANGTNCSNEAERIRRVAAAASRLINRGNYRGTARIDRNPGEEYFAKFDSPGGYTVCKAVVLNRSISSQSTFNASIQRTGEDGVGLYVVVPVNRSSGQHASANVLVSYVPRGADTQFGCSPNNHPVFRCKGSSCTEQGVP